MKGLFRYWFPALVVCSFAWGAAGLSDGTEAADGSWNADTPVADVLQQFGAAVPAADARSRDESLVKQGRELVTLGWTTGPDGTRTRRQSRYFICTDCHNLVKEDPDLRVSNPDARLDYCLEQRIPFVQGTTLYGTINKVSWYNEDYEKKYGDLVKPARESLENAIHLCATVCSQGRDFEEWEMKAVMAYLWSLELKLGDLSLSEQDWEKLRQMQSRRGPIPEAANWLKTFYLQASPATFLEPPADRTAGISGLKGNPDRGALVYRASCMTCHAQSGPSEYLKLGDDPLSLGLLKNNVGRYNRFSLYEIVRYGTHSFPGHRPYMPHYTAQRMSDQQLEDLRAYVESR